MCIIKYEVVFLKDLILNYINRSKEVKKGVLLYDKIKLYKEIKRIYKDITPTKLNLILKDIEKENELVIKKGKDLNKYCLGVYNCIFDCRRVYVLSIELYDNIRSNNKKMVYNG